MKNRIKIYAIALLVIYSVITIVGIVRGFEEGAASFMQGAKDARSDEYFCDETFDLLITPKKGGHSFAEKYEGVNGNVYASEPVLIRTYVETSARDMPTSLLVFYVGFGLLMIYILFVLVYIPILFCFIIRDVLVKDVFESSLIGNIRLMGWLLLSVAAIYNVFVISRYFIAKQMIEFSDYDILFPGIETNPLILGVIALFIAEVLKMSKKMKEDQELTI